MPPKKNAAEKEIECLKELLSHDRQEWDQYHEEFVCTLVRFGYKKYLTSEELLWYKDNVASGTYLTSINEYVQFS